MGVGVGVGLLGVGVDVGVGVGVGVGIISILLFSVHMCARYRFKFGKYQSVHPPESPVSKG